MCSLSKVCQIVVVRYVLYNSVIVRLVISGKLHLADCLAVMAPLPDLRNSSEMNAKMMQTIATFPL